MSQNNHHHTHHCATHKKIKNLTALSIVLAGFAVGSIFVDVAGLMAQRGFSAKAVDDAQVLVYDDATWVRYDEPRVIVDVVHSDSCGEPCAITNDLLLQLRRFIPTLEAHDINLSTPQGAQYQKDHVITTLPAFLFDKSVAQTAFYKEANTLFEQREDGGYALSLSALELPTTTLDNKESE